MSQSGKNTLVLHIGRPKTGSTAIQHFLVKNRAPLLQSGVLYPQTGRHQRASHQFAFAYLPEMRQAASLSEIDASRLWLDLADEVGQTGASTVILSSENFWFVDPALLPDSLTRDYRVEVIAYIRRQDNAIASSFCEEVKREQIDLDTDVEAYALYGPRLKLLDYHRMLSAWGERFGAGNVSVQVYEQLGGQIQQDICRRLKVDPLTCTLDPVAINPSFPFDVLQLIDRSRRFAMGEGARRRFVTMISEALALLDYDPDYDPGGLFPLELRQRIMQQFDASNAAILREFVRKDSSPLFPPVEAREYTPPRADLDPARMAQLFMGLYSGQERTNLRLSRRLQSLERQVNTIVDSLGHQERETD